MKVEIFTLTCGNIYSQLIFKLAIFLIYLYNLLVDEPMEEVDISELKPEKLEDKEKKPSKEGSKNKGDGDVMEEAGVEVNLNVYLNKLYNFWVLTILQFYSL
jgi:hypothetical protein